MSANLEFPRKNQLGVQNVSYSCLKGDGEKELLRNVSMYLQQGDLCAVLGPSGAGKSTLLDVIAGRKLAGTWAGNVFVDGVQQVVSADFTRCAYVIQQDLHIPTLTVEETIRFSVQLRLGSGTSDGEKQRKVDHILQVLSLTSVKDCRVGDFQERGLSGGQLKRLSIAVEMVADRSLLLLDEPTSGLDSLLSMEVISAVRKLASEGRISIATIHQPSKVLLEMFDKALVLVRGRVFFFGPVSSMVDYFSSAPLSYPTSPGTSGKSSENNGPLNPAEYVLDICCGQILSAGSLVRRSARELESLYVNSAYYQAVHQSIDAISARVRDEKRRSVAPDEFALDKFVGWPYPASVVSQLYTLMHRSWLTRVRDVGDLRAQLIKNIVIGVILGIIYFKKGDTSSPFYEDGYAKAEVQSLASILFQITLVTVYGNNSAIAYTSSSMLHFRREQASNVTSPLIFSLARYLTALPPLLFYQFVFILIAYLFTDLPAGAAYFFYLMFVGLIGIITSFATAMALTALAPTTALAYSIYPALAEFLITFSGYAIQIENVPIYWRWTTDISYPRWMFEGLMINHWNRYETDDYTGDAKDGNGDVLDQYDFSDFSKFNCIPIILLFTLIGLFLTYYGLRAPNSNLKKVETRYGNSDSVGSSDISSLSSSSAVASPLQSKKKSKTVDVASGLKENLLLPDEAETAKRNETNGDADDDAALPAPKPKLTVESFRASTGVVKAAKGCVLAFKDVCCEVDANTNSANKTTKVLLKSVSGLVLPGQMCALMGSSGAGKSSLLDVLAQRKTTGTITGEITYNGSSKLSSFAYVMQDDVHIGTLTVLETISFAAELRLPQNWPVDAKQKRVKQLIDMLMLNGVREHLVGGDYARNISGGELKRLSVAVEIVHLPDLMFLDEPTTGLDSSTSLEVVSALRNIANQTRTIICTIHQPSLEIFQLFDTALVLADARVVYFGPTSSAVAHFTQSSFGFQMMHGVDPADFIVAVASSGTPAADGRWVTAGDLAVYYATTELCLRTAANIDAAQQQGEVVDDKSSKTGSSVQSSEEGPSRRLTVMYQLQLLVGRKFLMIRRDWKYYVWVCTCDVVMSLFYGSVWFQLSTGADSYAYTDRLGVLNRTNVYMVIKHMDPGYIMNDRRMHYRERNTGAYGHFAYWVAVWLPRLPMELLSSVLFTIFMYPMSGLRVGFARYLTYAFFNIATNMCAFCLLSTVVAVCPSTVVAVSVVSLFQMITMSLNGFGIYLPEMQDWVRWAAYLDFARYGMQGMVVNEFEDNSELPEGQKYIHMLGYEHISVGGCAAIMLIYITVGGCALYLALKYVDFEVR